MSTDDDGGLDFDALLEHELRRRIGSLRGPSPAVGQAAYRAVANGRTPTVPLVSSLAAASSRIAVGLGAAALLVGGGTVAAAAAATHSADPANWGRTVTDAVASCKSQLGDGEHGIGQCVSAVARKHGEAQRDAHSQADADHGQPASSPSPRSNGNGHANGSGSGSGNGHPGASPTAHPGGKPTDVPAGPPASPASGGSHPTGPPVTPPTPSPRHE